MSGREGDTDRESGRTRAVPIYVAGFLALYEGGDGGELALPREVVSSALPPSGPVPINVDHRAQCEVGRVLTIVDDPRGPFFVGLVSCAQLEQVLEEAASAALFERRGPPLSREERLLYLITNYLPSVSLSSRRLEPGDTSWEDLFRHVALCVIGRRLGTIVTYDVSISGAVAPFQHLSTSSRDAAIREAEAASLALRDREWAPGGDALARTLLSTAVNSMMLRDRWSLVSERRRQAGIAGHTYLQASEAFGIWGAEPTRAPSGGYKEHARSPRATASPEAGSSGTFSSVRVIGTPLSTTHMNQGPPAAPQARPSGDDSYLWIPAAHYNQLVAAQPNHCQQQHMQFPRVSHGGPMGPPYGHPIYTPPFYGPGAVAPGVSPLETQIAALVGAIAADRQATDRNAAELRSQRGGKRRRNDYDDDDGSPPRYHGRDAPYYPGEGAHIRRAPEQRRPAVPSPDDTITTLIGAVSSLQQELAHMRSQVAVCAVPTTAPAPQPPPPSSQSVAQTAQGHQPQVPIQTTSATPQPAAAEPPPQVDASGVAKVDVDARRAADLFVAHMMGGR
ncbi:capsid maturation protease [Bovine alphaherpesvirus 2]|uniref:Capsid scaffolding protein n=1 Tax=Bovine alphaherpesvirus 2 TaxID=10295 RepID=A0ABX6WLR7_9ALPH|nr:capsid maturation protease [Bovine alphaherpesvirus 2]QPO25159.1 capsid maturation protease [Bovine alphaherpesvirus 2]